MSPAAAVLGVIPGPRGHPAVAGPVAAGWTDAEITAFLDRARAGDYDHLLRVVLQELDVLRSESGSASVSGSSGTAR